MSSTHALIFLRVCVFGAPTVLFLSSLWYGGKKNEPHFRCYRNKQKKIIFRASKLPVESQVHFKMAGNSLRGKTGRRHQPQLMCQISRGYRHTETQKAHGKQMRIYSSDEARSHKPPA